MLTNYISKCYYGGKFHFTKKGKLRYDIFNGASLEFVPREKLNELYSNPDVLFARKFDICESDVIDSVKYHLQNVDKKETI